MEDSKKMEDKILGLRLCQESKRWDQMIDKIEDYLEEKSPEFLKNREKQQKDADAKAHKMKKTTNEEMHHQQKEGEYAEEADQKE